MAQSKQQRRSSKQGWLSLAFLFALLPVLFADTAEAQEPDSVPLQLEVQMNGQPLNLIGAFSQMPDGKIGSPRSELLELGVAVSKEGAPEDIIMLDTVPGLSYAYDEENQSISLDVAEASRIAKEINAAEGKGDLAPESAMGLVVNYTGYSAASYNIEDEIAGLSGGSVSLDARAFSRFGTINQTGILGTTTFADLTALRLDTVWAYSDEKRALTYRLGDIVSGGLNWTRPVRLGGGQLQRNFELRPDLVTMPVPTIEGTAKVPSTVDVYIDGVKAYSGQLQEGPFKVDNLPVYTNEGTVKVVLTDATGREVETESEFITSPELLKRDLYDVSMEAGVLRRDFGSESFGYTDEPVAIGSFRYGISDILTGEAHAEIGMGLYSGGVGFLVSGGKAGLFSGAVAASTFEDESGVFVNAGWEANYGNLGVSAAVSRTFGDYQDLAAVSTIPKDPDVKTGVPKALDRISFSYSFPELKIGLGASFIHLQEADGTRSFLVSGSYSQTIFDNMTLYGSAYADFGDEEEFGAFVGLSIPLGETMSAMTSASATVNGVAATAEVSKSFGEGDMPTAWRVSHTEGNDRFTSASGAVRGSKAALQASVSKQGDSVRGNAVVEGALVAAGGTVMAGRKINDSFAIVNVGAPDVPVEFENRYAGKTGKSGKILLQDLNSFQKNKISINVDDLPLTAEVLETEKIVVPRDLSGVVVDFGVKAEQAAALVILTDAEGKFIPEGSEVVLEGSAESFVMGYDGQAYLTGIGSSNTVTVKHGNVECRAQFDFKTEGDTQTSIGPLTCT